MAPKTNYLQIDPQLLNTIDTSNLNTLNGYEAYNPSNLSMGATDKLGLGFDLFPGGGTGSSTNNWFDMKGTGGFALGALNTGISGFGTWMNAKNQKFMQGYYGDQMALQKNEHANNVNSYNAQLLDGQQTALNAQGIDYKSGAGKEQLDAYMSQWGAKNNLA